MRLDLYTGHLEDLGARARANPIRDFPTTWRDQFDAGWAEMKANYNLTARQDNHLAVIEPHREEFERVTGQTLEQASISFFRRHPMDSEVTPEGVLGSTPDDPMGGYRRVIDHWNATRPDQRVTPLPDAEALAEAADARRDDIQAEADDVFSRPRSRWGAVASLGGNLAGGITDPVTAIGFLYGAGAAAGILRTALVEAGIGAVTQAGIEAHGMATGWRQGGDPDYGLDDAALTVGATALAGGVLGGALKGGIKGYGALSQAAREALARRAAGDPSAPPLSDDVARDLQDSANVIDSELDIEARNPFDPTDAGAAAAHRAAMARAGQQTLFDGPVNVQDIVAEAAPRRSPPADAPDRVYTSAHRAIETRMEVVEADSLIQASGALQPRDRARATSDAWVAETAARLEPDRLGASPDASTGAPIVGPDHIIESGNGRVLAIRRAYQDGGEAGQRYRAFAEDIDPAARTMREPVVVRRRVSDLSEADRVAFVQEAQTSGTLRLSPTEQAMADARTLRDGDLGLLSHPDPGAAANRDFVRAFMDRVGTAEAAGMRTADGALSVAGHNRIQAALVARAYGDAALVRALVEDPDSTIRAIAGALMDVAGPWARMRAAARRGEIDGAMDITDDLMAAARLVAEARRTGQTVADLADQPTMFGDGLTPTARHLLDRMFRDEALKRPVGRKALAETLTRYLDDAIQQTPGPRLLGRTLTPDEILRGTSRRENVSPARAPDPPPRETLETIANTEDLTPEARARLTAMYEEAANAKPAFDATVRDIAEAVGGQPMRAPLKGAPRALAKVVADYNGNPGRIKDLLRATVVVDSVDDARAAVALIRQRFEIAGKPRDLFDPAARPADGYRDAKFNVRVGPDGHVAEVQVNLPGMLAAKEKAHALYEEREALDRSVKRAQRDPTPEETARLADLNARMRAIYDDAWNAASSSATKSRNSASESGAPLRRAELYENRRGTGSSNAQTAYDGSTATGTPSTLKKSVPSGKGSDRDGIISSSSDQDTTGDSTGATGSATRRMTPEEAEATVARLEEPEHLKALETEMQRILAENPAATFLDEGQDGAMVARSMRETLEHHARERAAAREVAACVIGPTTTGAPK